MSQRRKQTMEKGVDGQHVEVVVAVKDVVQGLCGAARDQLFRRRAVVVNDAVTSQHGLDHVAERRRRTLCQIPHFADNTLLHLRRGLVGEGHGQGSRRVGPLLT